MAPGKSSSVTLQSLLPDRAYKVTISAIHYTGESESTSTTGRTGTGGTWAGLHLPPSSHLCWDKNGLTCTGLCLRPGFFSAIEY